MLAKWIRAHTEAELIIPPALAIVIQTILRPDTAKKVIRVPLSNNTILRRIKDLLSHLKDQIYKHFEVPYDEVFLLWSLQVDESTDISAKPSYWLLFGS